jgi:hypothetical protein
MYELGIEATFRIRFRPLGREQDQKYPHDRQGDEDSQSRTYHQTPEGL